MKKTLGGSFRHIGRDRILNLHTLMRHVGIQNSKVLVVSGTCFAGRHFTRRWLNLCSHVANIGITAIAWKKMDSRINLMEGSLIVPLT